MHCVYQLSSIDRLQLALQSHCICYYMWLCMPWMGSQFPFTWKLPSFLHISFTWLTMKQKGKAVQYHARALPAGKSGSIETQEGQLLLTYSGRNGHGPWDLHGEEWWTQVVFLLSHWPQQCLSSFTESHSAHWIPLHSVTCFFIQKPRGRNIWTENNFHPHLQPHLIIFSQSDWIITHPLTQKEKQEPSGTGKGGKIPEKPNTI